MRITVDAADGPGELRLAVVMTGESAQRVHPSLKAGAEIRVKGGLKAVRRRLKSGLTEVGFEVVADSIELEGSASDRK